MRASAWLLLIFLAFLFALYLGIAGVDFGTQWDQNFIKGHVNKYIRTGNILPGEYHYPPVTTYIATSTTIPYALPFLLRYGSNWVPTQNYLLNEVLKNPNHHFLLNLRRVFVLSTTLAVMWTGIAAGQRNWLAGAVSAALLAFSWEVNYQSRIVHPDGPTMQFVALVLLFCLLAFYQRRPFSPQTWLCLGAAASAAAAATKYTAGISLLTVLLMAFIVWKRENLTWPRLALRWAALLFVFGAVFIILVPGVLLEQEVFLTQLLSDRNIYASGHGMQTVEPGWDYLSREFIYLFAVAFSPYPLLALAVGATIFLGAYALFSAAEREERWLAVVLVAVPVLYILFLATHRVLFVRNLLQVLPSLAILAGFGFHWLWHALGAAPKTWRLLPVAVLAAVLAFNAYWMFDGVRSIQARNSDAFITDALAYIADHGEQQVYLTPAARNILDGHQLPANATIQKNGTESLVLFAYLGDAFDEEEGNWPVNALGAAPLIFGPREINMDWYASWPGVERLVLARPELAWESGRKFTTQQAAPEKLPVQQFSGWLIIDGQQFMLEREDEQRLFIMNSANPKVVLVLKPHLDQRVTISGRPHSAERSQDFYLLSVNGEEILDEEQLREEYNFSRLFFQLTETQRQCLQSAVGDAYYRALRENTYGFTELSDEQLQGTVACLE